MIIIYTIIPDWHWTDKDLLHKIIGEKRKDADKV